MATLNFVTVYACMFELLSELQTTHIFWCANNDVSGTIIGKQKVSDYEYLSLLLHEYACLLKYRFTISSFSEYLRDKI